MTNNMLDPEQKPNNQNQTNHFPASSFSANSHDID